MTRQILGCFSPPAHRAAGLNLFEAATAAVEFREDVLGLGGPNERLGLAIPFSDEGVNGFDQVGNTGEAAASHRLAGEFGKPALDQIEPAGAGRNKVNLDPRALGEPALDARLFVGAVVVEHQMQFERSGVLCVELAQELQELVVAVAIEATAADLAGRDIQGGKQGGRAVPDIIVGPSAAAPAFERQSRLRAVQRLNLALLVHAQDDRMLRRVQIHPHHIQELRDKLRIARQFECFLPMRLQPVFLPNAAHRAGVHALRFGHRSRTPMRLARRLGLQCRFHDPLGQTRLRLAPSSRRHFPQAVRSGRDKALSPESTGMPVDSQLRRDGQVAASLFRQHDNPTTLHHLLRRAMRALPLLEQCLLIRFQRQGNALLRAHPARESQRNLNV